MVEYDMQYVYLSDVCIYTYYSRSLFSDMHVASSIFTYVDSYAFNTICTPYMTLLYIQAFHHIICDFVLHVSHVLQFLSMVSFIESHFGIYFGLHFYVYHDVLRIC
jgi:hypothetical protein